MSAKKPDSEMSSEYKIFAAFASASRSAPETRLFLRSAGAVGPELRGVVAGVSTSLFKIGAGKSVFFGVMQGTQKVGTAKICVVPAGYAVLAINIGDKTYWANFRKEMTQEMQVEFGLDLVKLGAAKAARAAANDAALNIAA